jgi:hypothetical protein
MKRFSDENFNILLLYMDDILIISHDAKKNPEFKGRVKKVFCNKRLRTNKIYSWYED